jgi:hypothetical protein
MTRWRLLRWRLVLFLWLSVEVSLAVSTLGSRTEAALLLMTCVFLYHRLLKPLSVLRAALIGLVLVAGLLAFGFARDFGLKNIDRGNVLATASEFQVLFANAYDLEMRQRAGSLEVPWQIRVNELYMPIPSQFLPFPKIDPADWYLEVVGLAGTGQGLMFGVIAQAIVGFDWIELVARGVLLAVVYGLIHRWYARRAQGYWPTLLYLFLCTWVYYTFRMTTFFMIYQVIYYFLPVVVGAKLVGVALSRGKESVHRNFMRVS